MDARGVRPITVASHPRSGTHLLIDALRLNLVACRSWKWWGERNDRLYLNLDHIAGAEKVLPASAVARILRRAQRPIAKTHAWPGFKQMLLQPIEQPMPESFFHWMHRSSSHLYIYRDGREVMRSLHRFMQSFDPDARVSLGAFMRQKVFGVSRARAWADHVRAWSLRENTYCVKMEELTEQPALTIGQLADHLDLPLHGPVLLPAATRSALYSPLHRIMHSRPQSTAILPRQRNGSSAPWHEQMTRDDMRFFRDETQALLVTLMYEQWTDWPERY